MFGDGLREPEERRAVIVDRLQRSIDREPRTAAHDPLFGLGQALAPAVRRRVKDVDISLAGGWIEVGYIVHPPGEGVVSMRPVSVFANGTGSEIKKLQASLSGQWRQATPGGDGAAVVARVTAVSDR